MSFPACISTERRSHIFTAKKSFTFGSISMILMSEDLLVSVSCIATVGLPSAVIVSSTLP
jgi:hypothetical protein